MKTLPERKYLKPHFDNGVFTFQQDFPFSWAILRVKHCRHPIAVMRVIDMFGHWPNQQNLLLYLCTLIELRTYVGLTLTGNLC